MKVFGKRIIIGSFRKKEEENLYVIYYTQCEKHKNDKRFVNGNVSGLYHGEIREEYIERSHEFGCNQIERNFHPEFSICPRVAVAYICI